MCEILGSIVKLSKVGKELLLLDLVRFLSSLILLLLKLRLSLQELATFAVASDAHRGQFGLHDVALPQPSGLTEQMTHGNIRQQVCKL